MELLGLVDVPMWLVLLTLVVVTWYIYQTWNFNYWKSMGVPGPKPYPFLGTMLGLFKDGFVEDDLKNYKKYGKIVGHYNSRIPALAIYDLDMLKQVLVKDAHLFINHQHFPGFDEYPFRKGLTMLQDDNWRNVRVLLTPTFSGRKIRRIIQQVNKCAGTLVDYLAAEAEKGNSFEAKEYLGAFTMDVIASTAFGIELDSLKDRNNDFIKKAKKLIDQDIISLAMIVLLLAPSLLKYLGVFGIYVLPKDVTDFFCNIIEQAVDARGEQKQKHWQTDFLQLMINAHKDTEGLETDESKEVEQLQEKQPVTRTKHALDKEELLAQGFLFFIAGYDTVATAASFLSYCLATNPECQTKLLQEIDDVMEGQDTPTYELLNKLPYLDMCISETLRLYPPAGRTDRESTKEHDVEINGLRIPKGTPIGIPVQAIHYDPDIWPDPMTFDPERFTPEAKANRHPMAWLPFGVGPRQCIGMRLALTEIKVAMVYILRKFSFITCEETLIPMKLQKNKTVAEDPGIMLKLSPRDM